MSDRDELDPDVLLSETPPLDEEPEPANPTNTCDVVDENGVCGESFDTPLKLGLHKRNVHGIAGKWSKENRGGTKDKKPSSGTGRKKKPAEQKAATTAAGPSSDRAGTYTASLSMAALACYFALPPFTQADLDVCNAGAPNIGRALGNLADHNQSVARTCDLILGGGAGGDWIAVVMAVVPVAGALAANHGLVPPTSGERFGAMIGVAPSPPTVTSQPTDAGAAAGPPSNGVGYNPESVDDVIVFMSGIPPTVMTDAMSRMMTMDAPVEVAVPFTRTVTENPDGHSGSEQLKPVEPSPEQEPASAVS